MYGAETWTKRKERIEKFKSNYYLKTTYNLIIKIQAMEMKFSRTIEGQDKY